MTDAHFEEDLGSEITVSSGDLSAAPGWALSEGSINRIGPEVMLHLEFSFAAGAAALALTLPQQFWPTDTVHTENGLFVISATDGTITYTGSTASLNAGPIVCEAAYGAPAVP